MATNSTTVKAAVGLAKASQKAYTQKWTFAVVFVTILFFSTSVAGVLDLLPETTVAVADPVTLTASAVAPVTIPESPTKIEIEAIDLSVSVANPTSTNIEVLDNALLKGVVRYPTSSKLGEAGNVIIFGHSSYLPIVIIKNFKAFDGIQDLKNGDTIVVSSDSHRFVYAVESVKKASATDDYIPLQVEGSKLTLATCNSFGQKSDRFVVVATLVETTSL